MALRKKTVLLSLLGISLALNVFAGGAIAAHFIRGPHGGEGKPDWRIERFSIFSNMGKLAPPVREKVRVAVADNDQVMRAAEDKLKTARSAVREAMRAEPFDAQALNRAYEEIRVASSEYQTVVQGVAMGVIAALTQDERKTLAERPRGKHRGHEKKLPEKD